MSCTLSSTETPANYENAECFRIVFSHSSIASLVLRRLSTAKVSKQTTEETLADVQDLDQRLRAWFESIPSCYRGGPPSKSARNPRAMSDIQSRYIFFIHRHSLINIHSQFCHPWNRPAVDQSESTGSKTSQHEHCCISSEGVDPGHAWDADINIHTRLVSLCSKNTSSQPRLTPHRIGSSTTSP